jgi:hypothetical protein
MDKILLVKHKYITWRFIIVSNNVVVTGMEPTTSRMHINDRDTLMDIKQPTVIPKYYVNSKKS